MRKRKFTTQFLTQRFVLEKINCSTLKCNKNHDIVHKYKYNYLTIKRERRNKFFLYPFATSSFNKIIFRGQPNINI